MTKAFLTFGTGSGARAAIVRFLYPFPCWGFAEIWANLYRLA